MLVEFSARREHSGCGGASFGADFRGIQKQDADLVVGQAPGDGCADDAAADDDDVVICGHGNFYSSGKPTKCLSPFMHFVAGHALGCVDGHSQIMGQTLPLFVSAPVGGAHILFEQPAEKLGNRSVFVRGFVTRPTGDLGIEADCDVLQHRISVTGGPRKVRLRFLRLPAVLFRRALTGCGADCAHRALVRPVPEVRPIQI